MKVGSNSPCPCGSKQKYKKCCKIFHNGALCKNALELMKSRYSAFVVNDSNYIIKTTHPQNPDYSENKTQWKDSIAAFSKNSDFENLTIIDFVDGQEEATVTFTVSIVQNGRDVSFTEKSTFFKTNNEWLYHSGEFIDE